MRRRCARHSPTVYLHGAEESQYSSLRDNYSVHSRFTAPRLYAAVKQGLGTHTDALITYIGTIPQICDRLFESSLPADIRHITDTSVLSVISKHTFLNLYFNT